MEVTECLEVIRRKYNEDPIKWLDRQDTETFIKIVRFIATGEARRKGK